MHATLAPIYNDDDYNNNGSLVEQRARHEPHAVERLVLGPQALDALAHGGDDGRAWGDWFVVFVVVFVVVLCCMFSACVLCCVFVVVMLLFCVSCCICVASVCFVSWLCLCSDGFDVASCSQSSCAARNNINTFLNPCQHSNPYACLPPPSPAPAIYNNASRIQMHAYLVAPTHSAAAPSTLITHSSGDSPASPPPHPISHPPPPPYAQ